MAYNPPAFVANGATSVGGRGLRGRRLLTPVRCCAHEKNHHSSSKRRGRVRLRRGDTHHSREWAWHGRRSNAPPPTRLSWTFRKFVKDADALVALLARILDALVSRWWRDADLVIEYGITDPNPDDKLYVDPLRDWDPAPVSFYTDSFGRRVYLCANAPNGLAVALEFAEHAEDDEESEVRNEALRNEVERLRLRRADDELEDVGNDTR